MKPKAIVIHELEHALVAVAIARELGKPVWLWSASDAASYAGIGWFDAIAGRVKAVPGGKAIRLVLDCGDRAELVQAAFRQGIRDVCYVGDERLAARLKDIAKQRRARLHRCRPRIALDLLHAKDPRTALRAWLTGPGTAH